MYQRHCEKLIKELLHDFRILYLTGPRQAGKTTLARKIAGDLGMHYVSLDEQTAFASARTDPQGFIDSLAGQPVVLNEFQYAPELIRAIKLASDGLSPQAWERGPAEYSLMESIRKYRKKLIYVNYSYIPRISSSSSSALIRVVTSEPSSRELARSRFSRWRRTIFSSMVPATTSR